MGCLSTAEKACSSSTHCPFIRALTKRLSSPVWVEGCFNEHGSNQKEIYLEGITLEVVETQGTIMQYADGWASMCCKGPCGFHCRQDFMCSALLKVFAEEDLTASKLSSSLVCVEIQKSQEATVSTRAGWAQGCTTSLLQAPVSRPQQAVLRLVSVRANRGSPGLNHAFVRL